MIIADPVYGPDFRELARVCAERDVALQAIKALTRGPWGTTDSTAAVWYEPLPSPEDIAVAVSFVLGHNGALLNTVGDCDLPPAVLDVAERFAGAPDESEVAALVERTRLTPLFVS